MELGRKLRVAIIGCGTVALDHLGAVKSKCGRVEVHLCDKNPKAIKRCQALVDDNVQTYLDSYKLISEQQFDVVHVLTPPDSHYDIAKHAIQNHANVLVEKPMALTLRETEDLYFVSERRGRMICVDHSLLYMDCFREAMEVLNKGVLGKIIAVHCFFGHSERKKTIPYGGVSHWSYNLPAGPLMNIISHPASVVVELLGMPDSINVIADARNMMPYGFSDLLDVSIRTEKGYGSFTISMAHGSSSRYANIECEKGGIFVDFARQLLIVRFHKGRLGFISKAFSGISQGVSFIKGTLSVVYKVASKKMKRNPGTRNLVEQFYKAVRNGLPAPVSRDNAIGVATIYEKVLVARDQKSKSKDLCHKISTIDK